MEHHQQYNEKSPPNIMRLFKTLLFVKQHEIENIVTNQCCESMKKKLWEFVRSHMWEHHYQQKSMKSPPITL